MFPLGKCSFQSHLSRCAALVGCECSPPCHSAAHTGKGGSAAEEGIGKASNSPDMCCGIFTSAGSSSHPVVCAWRHAQTFPVGQIPNVFESLCELWLSAECVWAISNRQLSQGGQRSV